MKLLALKSFKHQFADTEKEITYKELFTTALNTPPEGGFNLTEMEARLKVMNKLRAATDQVELEDAEMETLKKCVASQKWTIISEQLAEMLRVVQSM